MIALLPKENLIHFLARLSEKMEVIAPVSIGEEPAFVTWKGQPLALEKNPHTALEFCCHTGMFSSAMFREREHIRGTYPVSRLVFGVRPCDLHSVAILRSSASSPSTRHFDRRR
jgi:hypothetical protein